MTAQHIPGQSYIASLLLHVCLKASQTTDIILILDMLNFVLHVIQPFLLIFQKLTFDIVL